MNGFVLVVDDEKYLAHDIAHILGKSGFQTATASSVSEAMERVEQVYPDVVLMDLHLPDGDGSDAMTQIKEKHQEIEFIIVTANASIRSAVENTQRGAFDYLTKPLEPASVLLTVENAMRKKRRDEELRRLRGRCGGSRDRDETSPRIPYPSPSIRQTAALARRAAEGDANLLLLGESGTGKDHWSRWIHDHSKRRDEPYFSINCAALSRELAESELFGHEPGAFTGTRGRKRGLLELASGGTLLLNEVGELDVILQAKLLTFLDTKSFLRVGGERSITVDARIIAATNRDLLKEVEEKRFRQDLYYRLNVFSMVLPPLRERVEDIPLLTTEIVELLAKEMARHQTPHLSSETINALQGYSWPGNIRELRNVLERGMMLYNGEEITLRDLKLPHEYIPAEPLEIALPCGQAIPKGERQIDIPFPCGKNLHEIITEVTRRIIEQALTRSGSKTAAAKLLGISRDSLNYQIKKTFKDG